MIYEVEYNCSIKPNNAIFTHTQHSYTHSVRVSCTRGDKTELSSRNTYSPITFNKNIDRTAEHGLNAY